MKYTNEYRKQVHREIYICKRNQVSNVNTANANAHNSSATYLKRGLLLSQLLIFPVQPFFSCANANSAASHFPPTQLFTIKTNNPLINKQCKHTHSHITRNTHLSNKPLQHVPKRPPTQAPNLCCGGGGAEERG